MIRVIGYTGRVVDVGSATLVVGGARHLADVTGVRTVVMGSVDDAVEELRRHDGDAVVIASGDPGFFGIVRRLRAEGLAIEVEPAVSSVALAFARAGVEWDDAVVVSAHGRDPRVALAVVRTGGKVAVLTDARTGPREVAAAAPAGAQLVVAERLGEPDERVVHATPEQVAGQEWRSPNVVLVLNGDAPGAAPAIAGRSAAAGWALPEEEFEHRDGMVTKAEVRAWALARLAPAAGTLVWDIGAGSGSVGIECARLGAAAVLIERDRDQIDRARRNAERHGVRVQVVHGEAPDCLLHLPDPDTVFVGGGGPDVVAAVAAQRPSRVVVALAQLERVEPIRAALAAYRIDTVLLQASRLQPLGDGTRLVPVNPVFLVSGVLP